MNINSLFAVSVENTWGNVRVNGKEYLLNLGEKKNLFFIVPPVGDEVVWQKYDFFDNIFNMKAIGVNLFIKMPSDARADPNWLSSELFILSYEGRIFNIQNN